MSRAEETTKLTQNIVNAYDARRDADNARTAHGAKMKNDTITMLAKFDANHVAMSKTLKGKLAKDRADQKAATRAMTLGFASTSAQSKNAWHTLGETMQKKRAGPKASFAKPLAKATAAPAQKG